MLFELAKTCWLTLSLLHLAPLSGISN